MDYADRRAQLCELLHKRGITSDRVLTAIGRVPREKFVPTEHLARAYYDQALPIGAGQTISQPFIVGLMTQALDLTGSENVLEIGTGSGYQTAILSLLAREIVTVERLETLAVAAREILELIGLKNIHSVIGDGTLGWPEEAPYDAIIVTAAAPQVPPALLEQLSKPSGRLIIPIGNEEVQQLMLIQNQNGKLSSESLEACRFVKLLGEQGWH